MNKHTIATPELKKSLFVNYKDILGVFIVI